MKLGFGELELTILNLLKTHQEATVKELLERLPEGYAYTTIMTVCKRLEEKGALRRTREGKQFTYHLNQTQVPFSKALFTRLKNKVFGGSTLDMVSYLIEHADDVTEEELKAIEQMLADKRMETER